MNFIEGRMSRIRRRDDPCFPCRIFLNRLPLRCLSIGVCCSSLYLLLPYPWRCLDLLLLIAFKRRRVRILPLEESAHANLQIVQLGCIRDKRLHMIFRKGRTITYVVVHAHVETDAWEGAMPADGGSDLRSAAWIGHQGEGHLNRPRSGA
jgi:hypothetical protein